MRFSAGSFRSVDTLSASGWAAANRPHKASCLAVSSISRIDAQRLTSAQHDLPRARGKQQEILLTQILVSLVLPVMNGPWD